MTTTRRAWGLDSPRDTTDVTPCSRDPEAWDVPTYNSTSRVEKLRAYEVARDAVRQCRECPLLARCARQSEVDEVLHNCVYGGRVHFAAVWYDLAGFRRHVYGGKRSEPARKKASGWEYRTVDPAVVQRLLAGERIGANQAEWATAYAHLFDAGLSNEEIAARFGRALTTVQQRRNRYRRASTVVSTDCEVAA